MQGEGGEAGTEMEPEEVELNPISDMNYN